MSEMYKGNVTLSGAESCTCTTKGYMHNIPSHHIVWIWVCDLILSCEWHHMGRAWEWSYNSCTFII